MTTNTMRETFELITSLDEGKVTEFVNWYLDNPDSSETEHQYYDYIYDTIANYEYIDPEVDRDEPNFYEKCMNYSDGYDDCYYKLAKIIDETGY